MKLAAIDIGSNAVRLLFMNVYETENGPVFVKDAIYRVPLRLGDDVFLKGKITKEGKRRTLDTMIAFKKLMLVHGTEGYMICATSAMRDAKNAKEIIKAVKKKTGLEIVVISGAEEAEIIFANHVEKMRLQPDKNYLYIDVGGGSTELVLIKKGELIAKRSFNIGTLRLKHNKVEENEWVEMENWISPFKKSYSPITAIGSGGNINTLIKAFGSKKGMELSTAEIETDYATLSQLSTQEMIIKYALKPDRADVIIPAVKIYLTILKSLDIKNVFIPKVGLTDGIVHKLYEKLKGLE